MTDIGNITSLPQRKAEFEVGEVVRLSGGDVEMTVTRITGKGAALQVEVAWHDDARALIEAVFAPAALRFVEPARK